MSRLKVRFSLRTLLVLMVIAAILFGWWRDHRNLTEELAKYTSNVRGTWGTIELTGPPNTKGAGDIPTAWASATQDDQQEWLLLDYPRAIRPTAVVIHETYNPGAVFQITAFRNDGKEVVVWQGKDPTPVGSARGISVIPLRIKFKTKRIRVHIDSPAVPGWNEIDAVGLRDIWGWTKWAENATASSSYPERGQIQFSNGFVVQQLGSDQAGFVETN